MAHQRHIQKHCRICGRTNNRLYELSSTLQHADMSVFWSDIIRDMLAIDTAADDPAIHPLKFCHSCKMALTKGIQGSSASCKIDKTEFSPHPEDGSSCVICKYHQSKGGGGGRPKKSKRGGRTKDETNCVDEDLNTSLDGGHDYAMPNPNRPPSVQLARRIIEARNPKLVVPARPIINTNIVVVPKTNTVPLSSNTKSITNTEPPPKKARGKGKHKTPLAELVYGSSRERRLKPFREALHAIAEAEGEDLTEVWFWLNKKLSKDTPSQEPSGLYCLGFKVIGDFTDSQYKFIYHNSLVQQIPGSQQMYAPPSALKRAEIRLKPGFHKFQLLPPSELFPSHNDLSDRERCKPINIMQGISLDPSTYPPNMIGERYRYDKAIAQTLTEYQDTVLLSLNNIVGGNSSIEIPSVLDAYFKDGSDGIGDVSRKKGKTFRPLPNNALRYSFTLMEINFMRDNGEKVIVWRNDEPNSPLLCRTLMNAIADENDNVTSAMSLLPIEREKMNIQGRVIEYLDPKFPTSYRITIYTSMVDEKLERHFRGLDTSASNFACTICYYNRAIDADIIDDVPVEMMRTRTDTEAKAMERKFNDSSLPKVTRDNDLKGVKAEALMTFPSIMDATHADINTSGNLFKKLYVREIAEVYEWSAFGALKPVLKEAEATLDEAIRNLMGYSTKLMQGGNYGKDLVNPEKIFKVLEETIKKEDRLAALKRIIQLYSKLRRVWRATFPEESCPEELASYRETALRLGTLLRQDFSYFKKWTSYMHRILAHVPFIISSTPLKTCGGMATEAAENRNKGWRGDREDHSRQNLEFELTDNLRWSWLNSSFQLHEMVKLPPLRQQSCSLCRKEGHNIRTCPLTRECVLNDEI